MKVSVHDRLALLLWTHGEVTVCDGGMGDLGRPKPHISVIRMKDDDEGLRPGPFSGPLLQTLSQSPPPVLYL